MQTVEHLEGTMTDSEEGHASEVNLHFIRDGPRDKRHFFLSFWRFYPIRNSKEPRMLCRHNDGTQARVIIGNSIVDTISTEKYYLGPTDN